MIMFTSCSVLSSISHKPAFIRTRRVDGVSRWNPSAVLRQGERRRGLPQRRSASICSGVGVKSIPQAEQRKDEASCSTLLTACLLREQSERCAGLLR